MSSPFWSFFHVQIKFSLPVSLNAPPGLPPSPDVEAWHSQRRLLGNSQRRLTAPKSTCHMNHALSGLLPCLSQAAQTSVGRTLHPPPAIHLHNITTSHLQNAVDSSRNYCCESFYRPNRKSQGLGRQYSFSGAITPASTSSTSQLAPFSPTTQLRQFSQLHFCFL